LLACGFRQLAFCGSNHVPWDAERLKGFAREAASRGASITSFESRHSTNPAEIRASARRFKRWLGALPKPVGLFCADDVHASRALGLARDAEIRVPADLAVVGVDNNPLLCLG